MCASEWRAYAACEMEESTTMIGSIKAVLMLGGCALFALGYAAWTGEAVVAAENVLALHNRSSSRYDKECTKCHGHVLLEQSSDPSLHTAHLTMGYYVPGKEANQKCGFCHRTTDLLLGSTGNVRRHVDVTLCAVCHGPERAPTKRFYLSGPSPTQPDGPSLYALMCSSCHGDLVTSQVRGKSATEIRHKISENEGGMGPLRVLTTFETDAIARALAR